MTERRLERDRVSALMNAAARLPRVDDDGGRLALVPRPLSRSSADARRTTLPGFGEVSIAVPGCVVLTSIVNQLDATRASLVTVALTPRGARLKVLRVATRVQGYSARAVDTVEVLKERVTVKLLPTFFEAKLELREVTSATLEVSVTDVETRASVGVTFTVRLLARTTGFFARNQPCTDDDPFDPSWLVAFVTPNARAVTALLREVAERHEARKVLSCNQPSSASPQRHRGAREADVQAAFDVLAQRRLAYVSTLSTYGTSGDGYQRIRAPRETLELGVGNCADRSVLLASLLEAMGLSVGLVFVSGHTFVAWELPPGLSAEELPPQPLAADAPDQFWDYVDPTLLDEPFPAAVARARWNVGRAIDGRDPKLAVASVRELRARGVTPLE